MFNIGTGELFLILAVALIIFGPGKLPEIGRTLGKAMSEMRKATQEIQNSISLEDIDERPSPATPRSDAGEREQNTAEDAVADALPAVGDGEDSADLDGQPVPDSEPVAAPDNAEDLKTLGR